MTLRRALVLVSGFSPWREYPRAVNRTEERSLALRTLVTRTADNSAVERYSHKTKDTPYKACLCFGGGKRILACGESILAPSIVRKKEILHCGRSSREPLIIQRFSRLPYKRNKDGNQPSLFLWWR